MPDVRHAASDLDLTNHSVSHDQPVRAKQATKKLITLFTQPGVESGTLTLKVTSSGKPVQIDGLAVSKR